MTTRKSTPAAKRTAPKTKATHATKTAPKTPAVFTTVELAIAHDMKPKTLRARIRRNRDAFAKLAVDAAASLHVYPKANRKAVDALLA